MRMLIRLLATLVMIYASSAYAAPTQEQYAKALRTMAYTWLSAEIYDDARVLVRMEEEFSVEYLEELSSAVFWALEKRGILQDDPRFADYLKSLTANLWTQTKLRPHALSGYNYYQGQRVACSWKHFDPRCDYGIFQFNGSTVRMLWKPVFGESFRPRRDLVKVKDLRVSLELAVAYLQRSDRGICRGLLKKRTAVSRSGCMPYLRKLDTILSYPREGMVGKDSKQCRKPKCPVTCRCEVMRRSTGVLQVGNTRTAWWAQRYQDALDQVPDIEAGPPGML